MKKNKTDNKTLFIDATSECVKVTNNNKLTPENIDRIVDVFAKREEVEHFHIWQAMMKYVVMIIIYLFPPMLRQRIPERKLIL